MNRSNSLIAATAIAWLASSAASALPPGTVLEGSVETTTEAVIFPGDTGGRLQVRNCSACALSIIPLDARTQFLLAGDDVGLRGLAQYALRNPGHALTIHYRLKDKVASRVTVLVR